MLRSTGAMFIVVGSMVKRFKNLSTGHIMVRYNKSQTQTWNGRIKSNKVHHVHPISLSACKSNKETVCSWKPRRTVVCKVCTGKEGR